MKPVLGIGAVSGDFPAIGCRDEFIGWTKEQREAGKLNHSAVGSTIVATQPFGFNFLGGKLIAALITSKKLRTAWQLQYGDVLAGMTTTSLFGVPSMYDGLQWWKRVGLTNGSVPIQPKPEIYEKWLHYVQTANAKEFRAVMKQADGKKGPVTNYKTKVLTMIYREAARRLMALGCREIPRQGGGTHRKWTNPASNRSTVSGVPPAAP
jgi:hypothetical protein